ncbi:prolipoprotein diacylglyceryl transferase [Phenylobacterium montanum]|uniref:Phosphatidylglycerol--prolipoprotein diacylglyceryl transferase n=1 Tax=Phenylobacterium montanum TaxID=2823693 RepID=A0A975FXK0_9CAUL|nr:prolipoprotein diacylglyceryl transferase [Caulobacter sp. S6]QUD87260.1 prolipoprotein diacylglyceryl transferase [Caulobacter sp. S6]
MPFPHFDPVLIHLGPLAIRWYALAYIAGILLGWRYALRLIGQARLWAPGGPPANTIQIDDLILWVTLGIIVGGRTGYVLFYGQGQYWKHPLEIFKLWEGGMSFHGGFLGVALAVTLFARANRLDLLRLADLVAPCAPIGLFFGRIANFINGELWGRPTSLPWGIIFPSAPDNPPLPRHPSQLYEAGLEGLALFLLLRWATHRAQWLPRQGALTGLFLVGYGIVRISLENVRNPDIGMPAFPLGLTMGMILSIPMVAAGAWLIWRSRRPAALAQPAEAPQA